jgi:hypothetical protein
VAPVNSEHLAGAGGFAVVYVAEHTIWKQPVAVITRS